MENSFKIVRYIAALVCFTSLLFSCGTPPTPPPSGNQGKDLFMGKSDMGAYYTTVSSTTTTVSSELLFSKRYYQLIVSTDGKEYLIQKDDQEYFFLLEFASAPSLNQEVDVTLSTKGLLKFTPGNYKATLVQQKDGKKWFWISNQGYGFIVEGI